MTAYCYRNTLIIQEQVNKCFTSVCAFLNNMTASRCFFCFFLMFFKNVASVIKSVCYRPWAFIHRQKAAHLSAVTSGPLHLSVHHHFSWDTNITHDQRAGCYPATTRSAIGISVSFWTWMDAQRIPDASRLYLTLPQIASFCSIASSVWRWTLPFGLCDHKATFQLSSVHVVLLLLPPPQAQRVLSALLALSLPSAERRHLSDRAIISRLANSPLLVLTVIHCD